MKRVISVFVLVMFTIIMFSCDLNNLLSPARGVTGKWEGNLIASDNTAVGFFETNYDMTLDLKHKDNNITGTIVLTSRSVSKIPTGWQTPIMNTTYTGSLEGTISGVVIDFTTTLSNGYCLHFKGTFTSDIMEGMKNPMDPPMLTCGVVLNNVVGNKGIEWHLAKK